MDRTSEITEIAYALGKMAAKPGPASLDKLTKAAEEVGRSWSGSWLGYHSRVYYKDLRPVPPGARFSMEWGLMETCSFRETVGEWAEYDFESVVDAINRMAGNPDVEKFSALSKEARACFEDSQSRLLSLLSPALQQYKEDAFLTDIVDKIKKKRILSASDFAKHYAPSGTHMSRDMNAIQAGLQTPPHISVIAQADSLQFPFAACDDLGRLARRVASHLENIEKRTQREDRIGTNVFIGHGRSPVWKDLKDFIQDRLHLPWDEFNRVPVAGVANVVRLSGMLDEAAIAFLILTAEDEQADGKSHARMNVIHEVGLFQGRLGFERAIVLVEEGCEEFSNIAGLGQLRFAKRNIAAIFEEVRRVLEREGLIQD
jgi:predicted nucleotide-binding protein